MKKLFSILLFSCSFIFAFSQTGPGGVGNSSTNTIWLIADSVSSYNFQAQSGTLAITSSGTTITGTGTAFTVNDVGKNIRIVTSGGNRDRIIATYISGTQITVNLALDLTESGLSYSYGYVSTWNDISGNGRNATQGTNSVQPLIKSNILNQRAVASFDGADYMSVASADWGTNFSIFVVATPRAALDAHNRILETSYASHFYLGSGSSATPDCYKFIVNNGSANGAVSGTLTSNQSDIITAIFNGTSNLYENEAAPGTYANTTPASSTYAMAIAKYISGSSNYYTGELAEIIMYNTAVNAAQRIIINNYLSAKYGVAISNDKYSFDATHPHDLAGIGRVDASNIHSEANSSSVLKINSPSDLGDGEFLLFGHDNAGISTWTLTESNDGTNKRIAREWKFNETGGDVGTVTITFEASGLPFTQSHDFVLLVDADGDFTSGATSYSLTETGNNIYEKTGLNIADGDYITFGYVPCTTDPGTISYSPNEIFDGEPVTLSTTASSGTIQWQQSINGAAWTNLGTGSPYETSCGHTFGNTYEYRAKVTDGCSSYSNTVTVSASNIVNYTQKPAGVGNSCILWFKAHDIKNTGDGTGLSIWNDASGKNNNAFQYTSASQPTFENDASSKINGWPVLRFTKASSQFLSTTSINLGTQMSAFVVSKAIGTQDAAFGLLDADPGGVPYMFYLGGWASTANRYRFAVNNTFSSDLGTVDANKTILNLHYSGTSGNLYKDGTSVSNITVANPTSSIYQFFIGKCNGNSKFFNGDVAEIIYFNENLNSATRLIVENYLSTKYNITIANDRYSNTFETEGFVYDLTGVGQESDGQCTSGESSLLIISNPVTNISDGDYMLVVHNNGYLTWATGTGNLSSYEVIGRIWKFNKTNFAGSGSTIDVRLNIDSLSETNDNYYLVIDSDDDSDFGNESGGNVITLNNANNYTATITAANIADHKVTIARDVCSLNAGAVSFSTNNSIYDGGTVTMSVSGYSGGSTIQWQKSENSASYSDISGATSASYTTSALSSGTNYRFRAKITNSCSVYSNYISPEFITDKYVRVFNVGLTNKNETANTIDVQFDIAWGDSWRDATNWDAVWVFVKFKNGTNDWAHTSVSTSMAKHSGPAGITMELGTTGSSSSWGSTGLGMYLYRSAEGTGNINWNNVAITWNYGSDGLSDSEVDNVGLKVIPIEMVYIPQGSFYLGSGGTEFAALHAGADSPNPYLVTNETGTITIANSSGSLYYPTTSGASSDFGDQTGTLGSTYPKGYDAFYIMKYSLNQKQYVDFLNTLTRTQQATRCVITTVGKFMSATAGGSSSMVNRNGIKLVSDPGGSEPRVYGCDFNSGSPGNETDDGVFIACNWLNYNDEWAFADWAGLRPMTELEYEKATKGTASPTANMYAWGTTSYTQATGFTNAGKNNETADGSPNLACLNHANVQGPLRNGCLGAHADALSTSGASVYGVYELSGSLWTRVVTLGHATGRSFAGDHGDGVLQSTGDHNISNLSTNSMGWRGGSWREASVQYSKVCDRFHGAGNGYTTRENVHGCRLVRSASSVTKVLPVELLYFKAKCNDSETILDWATVTEINNDYFTIEKSEDLIDWDSVTTMAGCGNCNSIHEYHVSLNGNSVYYRLKQTDVNGVFKYFPTVKADCNSDLFEITGLYPNPFSENVYLTVNSSENCIIYLKTNNLLGQNINNYKIQIQEGLNTYPLNMSNLSKGVYYINISSEEININKNYKLIKQ